MFPRGIPIGTVTSRSNNDVNPFKNIQVKPLVDFSSLQSVIVLVPKPKLMDGAQGRTRPVRRRAVPARRADRVPRRSARRASCSSRCSRSRCCAARSSARSRASATGLLLDTATLGTLGVTSLLLTVGGFWIGRYGETTARDRFHAPFLSVAVVTGLYAFGAARAAVRARRAGAGRPRRARRCRSRCCSTSC